MPNALTPLRIAILAAIATLVAATTWLAVPAAVRQDQVRQPPDDTDTMLSKSCGERDDCLNGWTLTSRLGDMLAVYEKILGRRNPAYRLLGIEFTSGKRPGTWYPDYGNGLNDIIVRLTPAARYNRNFALFQLGHEAFHLIEPIRPNSRGSFFEEGLASYFAVAYMNQIGASGGARYIVGKHYKLAYDMIVNVANLHKSDFNARLRRLRELNRSFSRLTEDDIRAAFPRAPAQVTRHLAQPFATAK